MAEDQDPFAFDGEPRSDDKPRDSTTAHALKRLAALDPMSYGQERKAAAKALGVPVNVLDKEVARTKRAPARLNGHSADFIINDRGLILPLFTNAAQIIRSAPQMWSLSFDEFSQRPFLLDRPLVERDFQIIAEWVQRQGILAGREVITDAIMYVAHQNTFHAVRDWLGKLEWDGIPRIDHVLIEHAGAADTRINRAFTSRWMIQAVARIFEPGCQADASLILEGTQELGKSSFFRAIYGDEWFTDHIPNLDNKDAQIQLLGIWCIEMSELAAINKAETAKVKQFLTSRSDRFRAPYEKLARHHPRQSVFGGTVNPGAGGYLKDETGGRRYWPIAVGTINFALIQANRDQYWAEAVHRYRQREKWYLHEEYLRIVAREVQGDRYVGDPWQGRVQDFIASRSRVSLDDLFVECLDIKDPERWSQSFQNRLAAIMGISKWERRQRRINGKQKWVYIHPDDLPKEDAAAQQEAEKRDAEDEMASKTDDLFQK